MLKVPETSRHHQRDLGGVPEVVYLNLVAIKLDLHGIPESDMELALKVLEPRSHGVPAWCIPATCKVTGLGADLYFWGTKV